MYIILFDRGDRLGSNLTNYIAQIIFAHKNRYYIKFQKTKNDYRYYGSIFVKILFTYIDRYNQELHTLNIDPDGHYDFGRTGETIYYDWIQMVDLTLKTVETDLISYFHSMIFNSIRTDISGWRLPSPPFDVNKTILVHLRLGDVSNRKDYDGSECSDYYRNKIQNKEDCVLEFFDRINFQAPLSKEKIEHIINRAQQQYCDYKVILLTSPDSDTSMFDYDVIKNENHDYDLYLLSVCSVVILSRSTYALSSLFFNDINTKKQVYIPLWGQFVCCGLDTIYDNIDSDKITYFY
jgi:hypothetical protein